jgi:hypothetical protein
MEDLAATPPARMDADPAAKERWFVAQWSLLLQSWVLGDFLQAPQFQNLISDLMVANYENSTAENSNMLVAATPRAINRFGIEHEKIQAHVALPLMRCLPNCNHIR